MNFKYSAILKINEWRILMFKVLLGLEFKQYAVNNSLHPVLGRTDVRVM